MRVNDFTITWRFFCFLKFSCIPHDLGFIILKTLRRRRLHLRTASSLLCKITHHACGIQMVERDRNMADQTCQSKKHDILSFSDVILLLSKLTRRGENSNRDKQRDYLRSLLGGNSGALDIIYIPVNLVTHDISFARDERLWYCIEYGFKNLRSGTVTYTAWDQRPGFLFINLLGQRKCLPIFFKWCVCVVVLWLSVEPRIT